MDSAQPISTTQPKVQAPAPAGGFDPDAYLKQPTPANAQAFNPDAYLAGNKQPDPSLLEGGWKVNWDFVNLGSPMGRMEFVSHALVDSPKGESPYKAVASHLYNAVQTPVLSAPDVNPNLLPDWSGTVANPRMWGHVWNALHGTLESFESPLALATAPLGGELFQEARAGSKAAAGALKAMGGVFAALSAHALVKEGPDAWQKLKDPNASVDDKAKAVVGTATNGLMALAGALGVVHRFAPEVVKDAATTHIQEMPAKIVDAAGSVADPEKRAALIEAANQVAEVAGMPKTEVVPEPPVLPEAKPKQTVAAAAIKTPDGAVFTGTSHDNVRETSPEAATEGAKEGFVTSDGQFITREDAAKLAKDAGQLTPEAAKKPPTSLHSHQVEMKGEPELYGVAARVTEKRAAGGAIEPVEPGVGISPEASIERGRQALQRGESANAALKRFQETGALHPDDFSLVRAQGEQLAKAASDAAKQFGPKSPEYEAAKKADSDWTAAIKPMQTAWHKAGQAMQGETDLDTGDFHSLHREFQREAGRDFTPQEADKAQKIADDVRSAETEVDAASKKVARELGRPPADELTAKIWKRAKELLDANEDNFDDVRHKIADETGVPVDEVTRRLAGPKRIKTITDDMYAKMAKRRQLVNYAKSWVKTQADPGWERMMKNVPRVFFSLKVAFHGTVGMITHAGINMFDPAEWATYWPAFFEQYKLIGWHDSGAYHERAMQDLVRDTNYITARRAGLANAVDRRLDDYQQGYIGKIGAAGTRGFDALKIYRQARFSQEWNRLAPEMRTPEMAKVLADGINHSTGYVKQSFPELANTVMFAPKLEASRWAYLIGDPMNDARTFLNWKNASQEAKFAALKDVRTKARIAGTMIALLAANEGMLQAIGGKQHINFDDPRKNDFMAFKAAGYQLGIVSPMLGSVRYLVNLFHALAQERQGAEKKDTRFEQASTLTAKYARGKLSPFGGFVTDIATQADYQNRPLPFSSDKVPAYLQREHIGKYSWPEYLSEQAANIPLTEVLREVWMDQGMSKDRADHWIGTFATAVIGGGTGARMQPDIQLNDRPNRGKTRNVRKSLYVR